MLETELLGCLGVIFDNDGVAADLSLGKNHAKLHRILLRRAKRPFAPNILMIFASLLGLDFRPNRTHIYKQYSNLT
jgi:hypothetical protein